MSEGNADNPPERTPPQEGNPWAAGLSDLIAAPVAEQPRGIGDLLRLAMAHPQTGGGGAWPE